MRLVHLSDLHLGFRAFSTVERGWNLRELDIARAFRWAVREVLRLRPELILVTGDVFDHPDPPSTALLTLHRGLRVLRRSLPRTPVLVIAGERDTPRNPTSPGPVALLDTLPGVEAAAGASRVVRLGGLGLQAILIPARAAAGPPFPRVSPDSDARWNLLLIRGSPTVADPGVAVNPEEWNYVAVGGPHRRESWASNVHAPGSLERPGRDPWAFATEERGFLSVDLSTSSVEFHPIAGRAVVDLAPVRITPGDVDAGTRRFRDVLGGVPGGVAGKLVRARFEGDVSSLDEGVSPGLLGAVRRRAAHLEAGYFGGGRVRPIPAAGGPEPTPSALELVDWTGRSRTVLPLPKGISLVTAGSGELRARIASELRAVHPVPYPAAAMTWRLRFTQRVPGDRTSEAAWLGRGGWAEVIDAAVGAPRRDVGTDMDPPRSASAPGAPGEARDEGGRPLELNVLEAALRGLRADWIEAAGDLESRALEWARERQEAESRLRAYRGRALELRRRLRVLETEGEGAACPTCGRPMGQRLADMRASLEEEWESVVQDGRWWARRREQLEEKPEDLRNLEAGVLRLHARLQEEGERIERLRERERHTDAGKDVPGRRGSARGWDPSTSSSGRPAIRELLRRAGTILAQISDGRILGIRLGEDGPELVTGSGVRRGIEPAESAAVSAALHLALWLRDRERLGPGRALLLWEIHEPGASELAEALLELLYDAGTESDRIVCVVPPQVMDRAPERFPVAFEVAEDDGGRRSVRTLRGGHPVISLSPGV